MPKLEGRQRLASVNEESRDNYERARNQKIEILDMQQSPQKQGSSGGGNSSMKRGYMFQHKKSQEYDYEEKL